MPAQGSRGFSERVAVVSDGANVFGRAVALQLALQGCYVIVGFANSSPENERALNELQQIGTLAHAVEADVAEIAGVTNLFEQVEKKYGRLDLLVNTAQFESSSDFFSTGENEFTEIVNRNLKSTFFCSQAAVGLMKNRAGAAIVNLITENEKPTNALFTATQTALSGLTKALAIELAPQIRVNAVSFSSALQQTPSEIEFLRPATTVAPNDAARTVNYLLSPEAAAITGQTISVGARRTKI